MKSRIFGVSLGSAVFIFLMIAVLALVRPSYLRIKTSLSDLEEALTQKLEEETGLSLSYSSLSPSILTGINFKNIEIYEVASGNRIAAIKRAVFSYDLSAPFSKNPKIALKELTLNGIVLEYDAVKEPEYIEKIRKLLQKRKKQAEEDQDLLAARKDSKIELDDKEYNLPFDVIIKNLSLHYSDKENDLLASLKVLKLKDFNLADGVAVNTSGRLVFKTAKFKTGERWSSLASDFSVSGTFFPELEGSSALLSLSGSTGADYSLSHLDMLLNYSEGTLEVRTMRTVLPFSLFARYDVNEGSVDFSGDFDHFNPLKLILIRSKTPLVKKADGSLISGKLSGKYSDKNFTYKTNISLSLPAKLTGEKMTLALKSEGNKERIKIPRLSAKSDSLDVTYSGSFDFKSLQPKGFLDLTSFTLKNGGVISSEVEVEPYRNGFMLYAPQLYLGDKSFSGLEFIAIPGEKSVDFQFSLYDLAHVDYEELGHIQIDGSYMSGRENSVQASLSVSNIFADSICDTISFFLPAEGTKAGRRSCWSSSLVEVVNSFNYLRA